MEANVSKQFEKVVKSAVVIIPPENLWDQIQAIRKDHDKAYKRWPPHVNLLYPFVSNENFEAVLPDLKNALSKIEPFRVRFSKMGHFVQSKSCTLWLNPESEKPNQVHAVQSALEKAFPFCDDLSKRGEEPGFHPHLTVGQFQKNTVENVKKGYEASWKAFDFLVSEVYLISRSDFDDPFRINYKIPFGGKEPELVNAVAAPKKLVSLPGCKLFITNLSFKVNDQDLTSFFTSASLKPVSATVAKANGRPKGFGFVEYSTPEDAQLAIKTFDGKDLDGRAIGVKLSNK